MKYRCAQRPHVVTNSNGQRRLLIAFGAAAVVFGILAVLAFFLWQAGIASEKRALLGEQNAKESAQLAETRQAEAVTQRNEAEHQQKIGRSRELAALAQSQFDEIPIERS